uniref:Uncharacterized protein n=1 Tax=Ailuropoda melanoleuca TaxID=9646 RepID=A0A7N5K106_AILME
MPIGCAPEFVATVVLCILVGRPAGPRQTVTKGVESLIGTDWIHHSFSGSRIPENVFHPSPADQEKHGTDPQPLRTLRTVTRIKRTRRRPACGKDTMNMLGLEKARTPSVHKNIPPGNTKLLSQGLPAEEAVFPAPQGPCAGPSALCTQKQLSPDARAGPDGKI